VKARLILIAFHIAAIVVGVYGGLRLFDVVTK
jgi:hypothetical protein